MAMLPVNAGRRRRRDRPTTATAAATAATATTARCASAASRRRACARRSTAARHRAAALMRRENCPPVLAAPNRSRRGHRRRHRVRAACRRASAPPAPAACTDRRRPRRRPHLRRLHLHLRAHPRRARPMRPCRSAPLTCPGCLFDFHAVPPPAARATVDVARVDVGVAVDVDVRVVAAAVAIAAPRRADGGAPDHAGGERGTGRIRVVVRRIRRRVVDRRRALHDHGRRVVLRHVDHLRIRRLDDDDFLLDLHHLLVVGLEAARGLRLAAKDLHRVDHRGLVGHHRFAQRRRPVEIVAHHLDDVGIVEQRLHRIVPLVVDRKPWDRTCASRESDPPARAAADWSTRAG